MYRFTLPRDLYHGKDALSSLKNLSGKKAVVVVGGGSNVPGIGDYFTDSIVIAARVASPWQKLDFGKLPEPNKQFRPRYITVAGLASVSPQGVWSS